MQKKEEYCVCLIKDFSDISDDEKILDRNEFRLIVINNERIKFFISSKLVIIKIL